MAKTVDIIDPNTGESQTVPEKDAKDYLSSGFELDTPEAKAAREEEAKYSTPGQEAATGTEGLLRGGTLGLSDMAETGLGISTPEDIKKRREINPTMSGVSEGAGLVGSLFVPGLDEAEGAARTGVSALTSAPRATEAIGKGAGNLTKKILQGLGATPEGIATKIASSAADMAAQSEIYNAAQNVDETHLAGGNLEQAAENALASSGDALEAGAGFGAAIPVAGLGIKLAAAKAAQALSKVGAFAKERLPALGEAATNAYAKVAGPLSGAGEDAIKKDLAGAFTEEGAAMRERKLRGVTADERDAMQKEFQGGLQEAFETTQNAIKQGFRDLRPEETAKLTEGVPVSAAAEDTRNIRNSLRSTIQAMRDEPEIYSGAVARKLEIVEQGLTNKLDNIGVGSTQELFEMMDDLKSKALDPLSKFGGNISMPERDAINKIRELRTLVKQHLEKPGLYGEAAARQAAFNDAYASWRTLVGGAKSRGDFQKFFLEKSATKSGGFELAVSPTKINTYLNKVGATRDAAHTQALTDFLESSHNLLSELGKSAANAGAADFDENGVQSLLDTVKQQGTTNANRLQDAAKQRALANGPFVTSSPLQMVTRHGSLATAGAVLGGAPGAVLGAALGKGAELLTNPHEAMRTLSMLEGMALKTSAKISSGVKAGIRIGAELASSASARLRPLESDEIARDVHSTNREQRADYKLALREKTQTVMTPTDYQQHLAVQSPDVATHAPKVSRMMASRQNQISNYLNSKFPRDPSPMPPLGHGNDWEPSRAEWDDYQQVKRIASRPMAAVHNFRDGKLTADDVQVMERLWPNILGQMRSTAADAVSKSRDPLTSKQLSQLETLFGAPVDASQTPDFQAAVQQVWTKQAQAKGQSSGSPPASADKWSEQLMTPADRLAK